MTVKKTKSALALAATLALTLGAGSSALANKGTGKEAGKGEAQKKAERAETANKAGGAARAGADGGSVQAQMAAVKGLTIVMKPAAVAILGEAAARNAEINAGLKDIASTAENKDLMELNGARIQALANIAEASPTAEGLNLDRSTKTAQEQATVAYDSLAIDAGAQAKDWDPAQRELLTFVLSEANKLIAANPTMNRGEALIKANELMLTMKKKSVDLSKVREWCKKKV